MAACSRPRPPPAPTRRWEIARRLDPALVDRDLAAALGRALAHEDPAGYAARALAELAPMRAPAVDALVANELLPRLLDLAPASAAGPLSGGGGLLS